MKIKITTGHGHLTNKNNIDISEVIVTNEMV